MSEDEVDTEICQFASAVGAFTSQYGTLGSLTYTCANIVGRPSQYPNYGDFVTSAVLGQYGTWRRRLPSSRSESTAPFYGPVSQDFIDVEFDECLYVLSVRVYEVLQPGAVVRISAQAAPSRRQKLACPRWHVLWQGGAQPCPADSRVFAPRLKVISHRTSRIRLEFNSSSLEYFTAVDAVELVGCRVKPSVSQLLEYGQPGPITVETQRLQLACGLLLNAAQVFHLQRRISESVEQYANYRRQAEPRDRQQVPSLLLSIPEEIIVRVLSYLDLVSLGRVSMVCRQLRRLCQDPLLFSCIDLKPYWYLVDSAMMSTLCSRQKSAVSRLNLSWCGNYGAISPSDFCRAVAQLGDNLATLCVDVCHWFDDICLEWTGMFCRNLEELSLRCCTGVSVNGFSSLQYLCRLRFLELYGTMVSSTTLLHCLQNTSLLQYLGLGQCVRLESMGAVLAVIGESCRDLLSLVLWRVTGVTWHAVTHISHLTRLRELDLGWCRNAVLDGEEHLLCTVLQHLPELRRLDLSSIRFVSDADILQLCTSCRLIEQLIIVGASLVQPHTIEILLLECTGLRLLDVSYCSQIEHSHVDEWRSMAPHCHIYIHAPT